MWLDMQNSKMNHQSHNFELLHESQFTTKTLRKLCAVNSKFLRAQVKRYVTS